MQSNTNDAYGKQEMQNRAVNNLLQALIKMLKTLWGAIRQVFYEVFRINLP